MAPHEDDAEQPQQQARISHATSHYLQMLRREINWLLEDKERRLKRKLPHH